MLLGTKLLGGKGGFPSPLAALLAALVASLLPGAGGLQPNSPAWLEVAMRC